MRNQDQVMKQVERWKQFTLGTVKAKVAKEFQLLVRLRHTDKKGNTNCCSCGKKGHYKTFDAGHWMSRTNSGTLYEFRNVHPQCKRCNAYQGGNRDGYDEFMNQTYGKKVMNELRKQASTPKQFTRIELAEMIVDYREEIKQHELKLKG